MNSTTCIYILKDTIKKKNSLLEDIIVIVKQQELILGKDEVDLDLFDEYIDKKQILIDKLIELDNGFEIIYNRVRDELKNHSTSYSNEIADLQALIRGFSEKSLLIQNIEKTNHSLVVNYFTKRKREVKEFKTSNEMVNNYYKNMTNVFQQESYFLDKKK